jgi:hypothetical protein
MGFAPNSHTAPDDAIAEHTKVTKPPKSFDGQGFSSALVCVDHILYILYMEIYTGS